jgi:hypothetical protein
MSLLRLRGWYDSRPPGRPAARVRETLPHTHLGEKIGPDRAVVPDSSEEPGRTRVRDFPGRSVDPARRGVVSGLSGLTLEGLAREGFTSPEPGGVVSGLFRTRGGTADRGGFSESGRPASRRRGRARFQNLVAIGLPGSGGSGRPCDRRRVPAGLRSSPEGLRSAPAGLRSAPESLRGVPESLRSSPESLRRVPAGLRNAPAGLRNAPAGLRGEPASLRGVPESLRNAPASLRGAPASRRNMPAGQRGAAENAEETQLSSLPTVGSALMRLEIATEHTEDAEEALHVGSLFGVLGVFGGNFALEMNSDRPPGAELLPQSPGHCRLVSCREFGAFVISEWRLPEGGASAVARSERTATDRTGALTRAHGSTRYRASLPCLVSSSRRIEGRRRWKTRRLPRDGDDPCAREARLSHQWLVFSRPALVEGQTPGIAA